VLNAGIRGAYAIAPALLNPLAASGDKEVMGEVMHFPRVEGADLVVNVLQAVCERRGVDVAVHIAEQMIVAASSIVAHERGRDRARHVLDLAGAVLPASEDGPEPRLAVPDPPAA
jgi:hypothetical protein